MIEKGIWEETELNLKRDFLRLIEKKGQRYYNGKPVSSLLFFYNRLFEYYNGISVAFRTGNMRHPEDVVMYVYIQADRIPWIRREMLSFPAFAEDVLLRRLYTPLTELNRMYRNDNKAAYLVGKIYCQEPDHTICRRSGLLYDAEEDCFILKLRLLLPTGSGSTILGQRMSSFLSDIVKLIDEKTAYGDAQETEARFVVYRKQWKIRSWCRVHGYVTFVANGSILPRQGDTEEPAGYAVPFQSPRKYQVQIPLSEGESIVGMALGKGVTVITGAGFSGKTTLLEAIDAGIYDHIPGDGREFVLSDRMTVVTNAEDGRYIGGTDMSTFFRKIPGQDSRAFSTTDASGSVSQAANIIEAIQSGARLLLIDEDKSATNLMICDQKMRALVPDEIIIPFTDRIDELVKERGLSCIIVIGGSSEYFRYADNILVMRDYQPHPVLPATEAEFRQEEKPQPDLPPIVIAEKKLLMSERDMTKLLFRVLQADKVKKVIIGEYTADVTDMTAIHEENQLHGLAAAVFYTMALAMQEGDSVQKLAVKSMEQFWQKMTDEGYLCDEKFRNWFISEVRPIDVMMTIHRMRGFVFQKGEVME